MAWVVIGGVLYMILSPNSGIIRDLAELFGKGESVVLVMRDIRLPRALLGLMIGAVLGLSGAAMQGYLRNPLAEPGLIGVEMKPAIIGRAVSVCHQLSTTGVTPRPITS